MMELQMFHFRAHYAPWYELVLTLLILFCQKSEPNRLRYQLQLFHRMKLFYMEQQNKISGVFRQNKRP